MNLRFAFQLCLYLGATSYGISYSLVFELFSENERIGNTIANYDVKSAYACLILCNATSGCLSVNFHKGNKKCLLTDHYPVTGSSSGTPDGGWKIYFQRIANVNLMDGAVAWQSSPSGGSSAGKAIDGVTISYPTITTSCFYQETANSYWAVEFGTAGFVKEVDLYLYSLGYYYRNTGFTVSVATVRDDVINDLGTVCGAYNGPNIDTVPFELKITCGNIIYGKFLKVKHTNENYMQLCEVVVHTPFE